MRGALPHPEPRPVASLAAFPKDGTGGRTIRLALTRTCRSTRRPMRHRAPHRAPVAQLVVAIVLALGLGGGCVTIYDPQSALQRPVALDITRPNFEGMRIRVRCYSPNELVFDNTADTLCMHVATLMRNQGAEVDTEVLRGPRAIPAPFDEAPDLILELDGKLVHQEQNFVLTYISSITMTLIPTVVEETYEQTIVLRDARGAVLASERPRVRFITYLGVGIWVVNWILDVSSRKPEDRLTGDAPNRSFSRDFYGLVSQLAFNARVRQRLMQSVEEAAGKKP